VHFIDPFIAPASTAALPYEGAIVPFNSLSMVVYMPLKPPLKKAIEMTTKN